MKAHNDAGTRVLGDDIIRSVAEATRKCVRDVDVVARYGGEEFLVVLPSTHFGGAVTVAERIWREVTEKRFTVDGIKFHTITVSIGVALYPSRDVRTKDALVRAADGALQQAKRDGGNRICVFQQQGYIYTPTTGTVAAVRRRAPALRRRHLRRGPMTASFRPPPCTVHAPVATIVPAAARASRKIARRACSSSTTSPMFAAAWRAFS